MNKKNIDLIRQALGAAESSIRLAKQLLNDVESGKTDNNAAGPNSNQTTNVPGITGSFDGENMVTASGETFPVPTNYASKSMLVVGDTLKMVEEGKEKRFKQIEHVKRYRTTGIITKKDGKWKAITPEGSYKVLPTAVEHLGADVGSEVVLHLPANNLTVAYAAIESVKNANKAPQPVSEETVVENKAEKKTSEPTKKEITKTEASEKTPAAASEKEIPKAAAKVEQKNEPVKKEVAETKVAKEPKKEDKPKTVVETKPTATAAVKTEPAKPVVSEEVKPAAVATNEPAVVEKVPEPTVASTAPKSMEISPEEDELT